MPPFRSRIDAHDRRGAIDVEVHAVQLYNLAMRNIIALALVLTLAASFASAQPLTVIKAGTLIDGRSNDVKHNQVIVIRGNRIESVGANAAIDPSAKVIDLSNMTVLPGLIDTHTHIFLQGEDPAAGGYD